jgi:murein DD-endopeptidase / murein LD-carboxypeptidase
VAQGANCQLFAYALLELYGITVPPWRSSELWTDTELSRQVTVLEPLDLMFWNRVPEAWGAHVGVYLGEGPAAHLSKAAGLPLLQSLEALAQRPEYRVLLGAKRVGCPTRQLLLSSPAREVPEQR